MSWVGDPFMTHGPSGGLCGVTEAITLGSHSLLGCITGSSSTQGTFAGCLLCAPSTGVAASVLKASSYCRHPAHFPPPPATCHPCCDTSRCP